MEENETHKDIELKSEEVQEVMNHIPSSILRYGISGHPARTSGWQFFF